MFGWQPKSSIIFNPFLNAKDQLRVRLVGSTTFCQLNFFQDVANMVRFALMVAARYQQNTFF
jgi:hypothetical protein